ATTIVHRNVEVETSDYYDHTFAGIMVNIEACNFLPVDSLYVFSVWVRGDLGPMTVWSTQNGYQGKEESQKDWVCHYSKFHEPSVDQFQEMRLQEPICLKPGDRFGLYVHSACYGDDQIVYDNQRHHVSHSDNFLRILPGKAHLSHEPFSPTHENFGGWGRPWRENREFVGR
ncbi:hypothetical protein GUITHDRAFT_60480, partial [Guillardia theta CCMP2712]